MYRYMSRAQFWRLVNSVCSALFANLGPGAFVSMAWYAKGRSSCEEFGDGPYLSDFERDVDGSEYSYGADDSMDGTGHQTDSEPDAPESEQEGDIESPPELGDKQFKRRCMERSPDHINVHGVAGNSSKVTPCTKQSRPTLSLSAGHTPVIRRNRSAQPKVLSTDSTRCNNGKESLSAVLGNITNMLGTVIERLDKQESKLESMERKINTPSSSGGSGSDNRRKVPTVVRVS